jgi:hypothetical protein
VKKVVTIVRVLLIIALYSFTIGVGNCHAIGLTAVSQLTTHKQHHASAVSPNLLHASSQAGSLETLFNSTSPTTVKDTSDEFSAFVKVTEALFFNEFSQYTFSWRNLLIKFRKADLIFPFNYFW